MQAVDADDDDDDANGFFAASAMSSSNNPALRGSAQEDGEEGEGETKGVSGTWLCVLEVCVCFLFFGGGDW